MEIVFWRIIVVVYHKYRQTVRDMVGINATSSEVICVKMWTSWMLSESVTRVSISLKNVTELLYWQRDDWSMYLIAAQNS